MYLERLEERVGEPEVRYSLARVNTHLAATVDPARENVGIKWFGRLSMADGFAVDRHGLPPHAIPGIQRERTRFMYRA